MKKKLIVVGAAAALSAAAAVPAFALENEIHGSYKMKYFLTNAEKGDGGFLAPKRAATAANYFETRTRLFYTAKANDDLKLVTGFEIDTVFGDKAQGGLSTTAGGMDTTAFRNSGGALESDAVNLETKWIYLDFNLPSTPVKMKVGVQPYKDAFKGILLDADIAGVYATAKYGAANTGIAYFRAYEQTNGVVATPRGTDNLDIALLEGNYAINKDLNVGGAYYLYSDYRQKPVTFHTFGVNADAKIGPASVSGFFAYQAGFDKNSAAASKTISAFAANVAGKLKVGPGTAKTAFLYTSGDQDTTDGVQHAWQTTSQIPKGSTTATATTPATNTYNESGMMLLNRNAAAGGTTTDIALQYTTNNNNQGSVIAALGYDAAITPKFYVNTNVGFGLTAENNATRKVGSHFQGTEVNVETGYKVYDNLTASIQAAYVFLGPYYKDAIAVGTDPVDPYTARVALTYAF